MRERSEGSSIRFYRVFDILMLALFLPVLFCVMFIGNGMDYFDDVKADILVPNVLLTLAALLAAGICVWLIRQGRKVRLDRRTGLYLDLALVILFIFFFFFCMALSRETVFDMAVDPGIVRKAAWNVAHGIPFGYQFEFSMNHNNLPIIYILGRLYRFAENLNGFDHHPEYLWVMVGCLSVTGAGFCCCEIVKKLTRNVAAVLIAFAVYLATAGICPWKYIPYTDSYVIIFPVLCVWLYLCSLDCKKRAGKLLFLFFSLLFGVAGGFVKPNAYIAVLAVLCLEGVSFLVTLVRWVKGRKASAASQGSVENLLSAGLFLICGLLFFGIFYWGTGVCKEHIIQAIGLEYNPEIEATPQYFFFMGSNELTTGSFTIQDYGIFGEFQFSKADRNQACLERAWERIRERGVLGTVYFCLKKLVKSFNDGSFAWTDVLYNEPFPENLAHDNRVAGYLRSLFMPGGVNQGKYDTFAELVWIFTLLGVPGIVLISENKKHYSLFSILVIGILIYLMLFESGARYVYIFLPVFIVMSVCGLHCFENMLSVGGAVAEEEAQMGKETEGRGK